MKKDGFLDFSAKALGVFSALSPTVDIVHDLLGLFSEAAAPAYTCPIDENCLVDGESKQKLTGADLEYWRYEFVAFCADYVFKRRPEIPIGGFNQLRQALMDSGAKFHLSTNDNKRRPQKLSATPDHTGKVLPLCPIPNSASQSAPPFKSVTLRTSVCAESPA